MNFTYEFPDITGYIQKAALIKAAPHQRTPSRRKQDSRRKTFPSFSLRRDEDKDIDYFTVSMKEKISLFDEEVTSLGCSFVKGKAALLFADFIFFYGRNAKPSDLSFRQTGKGERCSPLDGRGNFHFSHGK